MGKLLCLSIMIVFVFALSLQTHEPLISAPEAKVVVPTQLRPQSIDEKSLILLKGQINRINNKAGFISRSLQLNYKGKYESLMGLFKNISVGIRAIKKSLIKNGLPINSKQKLCPKVGSFNASEINRYTSYTLQKMMEASSIIIGTSELSELHRHSDHMLNATKTYLNLISQTLKGKFCNEIDNKVVTKVVVTPKVTYKNNLKVDNWYYGSTSKSKYSAYLAARAQSFNLTHCPSDKPFVRDDEEICFNCPPHAIYNLGQQKCESCKPGEMLDIDAGNVCKPCYGQKFIVNHRFICKPCAIQQLQLYNPKIQKCYKCGNKEFLDEKSRSCKPINCTKDKPRYNRELMQCQACPKGQVIDKQNLTNCIDAAPTVKNCPKELPYFDQSTRTCRVCPDGAIFNQKQKTCELKGNVLFKKGDSNGSSSKKIQQGEKGGLTMNKNEKNIQGEKALQQGSNVQLSTTNKQAQQFVVKKLLPKKQKKTEVDVVNQLLPITDQTTDQEQTTQSESEPILKELLPNNKVKESTPNGQVKESLPINKGKESPPNSQVEKFLPVGKVKESTPNSQVKESPPNSQVKEFLQISKVNESLPNNKSQQSTSKNKSSQNPKSANATAPQKKSDEHSSSNSSSHSDIYSSTGRYSYDKPSVPADPNKNFVNGSGVVSESPSHPRHQTSMTVAPSSVLVIPSADLNKSPPQKSVHIRKAEPQ